MFIFIFLSFALPLFSIASPSKPGTTALVHCERLLKPTSDSMQPLSVRMFEALPAFLRGPLALRNNAWGSSQMRILWQEVESLWTTQGFRFMAMLPQTSHTYILGHMPEIPELRQTVEAKLGNSVNSADLHSNRLHHREWLKRLHLIRSKLHELEALALKRSGMLQSQMTMAVIKLKLGVFYAGTYGFEAQLNARDPDLLKLKTPEGRKWANLATHYFQSSIECFEKEGPQENAHLLLFAKFLLGKHALNGAEMYSRTGEYHHDSWEKVPAEPETFEYLDLAQQTLVSVLQKIEIQAANRQREHSFSFLDEIAYETRYALIRQEKYRALFTNPESKVSFQKKEEALLMQILFHAPASWVLSEMRTNSQYNIFQRLINEIRHARHDEGSELNDAIYAIGTEIRQPSITYEAFIRMLIGVGYPQLKRLLKADPYRIDSEWVFAYGSYVGAYQDQ